MMSGRGGVEWRGDVDRLKYIHGINALVMLCVYAPLLLVINKGIHKYARYFLSLKVYVPVCHKVLPNSIPPKLDFAQSSYACMCVVCSH